MTLRSRASVWAVACLWLASLVGCGGGLDANDHGAARSAEDGAKAASKRSPVSSQSSPARRVELVWPTPNKAFAEGKDIAAFIQPTASGEVRSGLFGSVRSGGRQFHEGLDLLAITRDKKGESIDPVGAAMAGVVRYVSNSAGNSNYGRYVVLEHPQERPSVYTLYAHLRDVAPGLQAGRPVAAGERLGTMGRTSSGSPIPKDRAHLHFEIGLRVTNRFAGWYAARGFGSPNPHGIWNGMNLVGLNPLDVFTRSQAGGLNSLAEVFAAQSPAVVLQIANAAEPDFVGRYPELVATEGAAGAEAAGGWEITLNETGLPFRWRRLAAAATVGFKTGEVRIQKVDEALLAANRGRKLVVQRGGRWAPDEHLSSLLEQLFTR